MSSKLSYILRHSVEPLYVDLNGGWAAVDEILAVMDMTREELDEMVREDNKNRYSYDSTGTKVRANQGHSIPGVVVDMANPEPPELLYHGTATRFLGSIMCEGLKPMARQWVHLSPDPNTAFAVGSRHGKPVVLIIRAKEFVADGHELYLSSNGVWQARSVPPEYIGFVGERRADNG